MPISRLPLLSRQTMPLSIIEAASEPASGLVKPKQGISAPEASRGSQCLRCSSVPKRIRSSPGPSEFGTITVTAAVTERLDNLRITSECAKAEKPSPPCSLGMIMPQKRCCLMNSQASGGRSRSSQLIFQSSQSAQSSSTGPSRKACSSAESFAFGVASNFDQSGLPVNNSASHHTSPASSASRSVSDMVGSAFFAQPKIGRVRYSRRQEDMLETFICAPHVALRPRKASVYYKCEASRKVAPMCVRTCALLPQAD